MPHFMTYTSAAPLWPARREELNLTKADYRWPLIFMLTAALLGLNFYPAILGIFAIILNRWRHDRYDCAIMIFLSVGAYGVLRSKLLPGVPAFDIGLIGGVICMMLLRKPPVIKLVLFIFVLYGLALFYCATQSTETMGIQIRRLRYYFSFITFFIPLAVFADRAFDIKVFFRKLMPYVFLMCGAYVVDAFILKSDIFAPGNFRWDGQTTTFYHPILNIFSLSPHRKYPYGLYIVFFILLPAMRMFRLKWWEWGLIALAAFSTMTFTYMATLVLVLVLFQGSFKRFVVITIGAVAVFWALYFVDSLLPEKVDDWGNSSQSALRIKSSVDQFTSLFEAVDDEDLAEFGSGRMAQAIPKLDLVDFYGKQATGLGFLHPELSNSNRFTIVNEYYIDVSDNEEVATGVEIGPIQTYIDAGWIGLTAHFLFFLSMYLIVARMRYSSYFLSILICVGIMGLSGFASLAAFQGQHMAGFAFAVVILANRSGLGFSPVDSEVKPTATAQTL